MYDYNVSDWYARAKAEGRIRNTDPTKTTSFAIGEWLWGLCAVLRSLWNSQLRAPYRGLAFRKALVLMRLRGERPMTVEEVIVGYFTKDGLTVKR